MNSNLSIIVLNHNHNRYLPVIFDSILEQSAVEPEVVLVDDFSDEPCGGVVEAYRSKGLDVNLIAANERLYIKNARVAGMRAARGRIVAFADADDRLGEAGTLAANVALFDEQGADILHFRSAFIDEAGSFRRYFSLADPLGRQLHGLETFEKWLEADIRGTSVCNKLYSRDLCAAICDIAWQSKVLRNVEEIFLTSLFFMHSRKYVGSDLVGYGYNWAERGWKHEAGCAVYTTILLDEMLPVLRGRGLPGSLIRKYELILKNHIALTMGHAVSGAAEAEDGVEYLLRLAEPELLLRAMLTGGKVNADKLADIFWTLRGGARQ